MMKHYKFAVEVSGGNGQTFAVEGGIVCEWGDAFRTAMEAAFHEMTQGRAVYGKPGVGCQGPYDLTKITIEQVKQ